MLKVITLPIRVSDAGCVDRELLGAGAVVSVVALGTLLTPAEFSETYVAHLLCYLFLL